MSTQIRNPKSEIRGNSEARSPKRGCPSCVLWCLPISSTSRAYLSAKRTNVNSRGCQPTETAPQNGLDPGGVEQWASACVVRVGIPNDSTPPGLASSLPQFSGFHPELFTFGPSGASATRVRAILFLRLFRWLNRAHLWPYPSAKRTNMNSRGWQPTETRFQDHLDPERVEQHD
jgi:hypothetical protein